MGGEVFSDPGNSFWLVIYAISLTVLLLWCVGYLLSQRARKRCITWDLYSEYIDISEFSNRNIPLRVTYRGTEPRWLWVTYVSLRNTGRYDIQAEDCPERQHFIAGADGCRYIGFNRLISDKAKVTLSPLFKGNDVFCKIDFDRLGPGDEILVSLLYVADEHHEVSVEGSMFGASSRVISGYLQRMRSWRSLWWLLICMIVAGSVGGFVLFRQAAYQGHVVLYHLQTLLIIYLLALIAAAVFLRPIRFWQQLPDRFRESNGERQRYRLWHLLRFILGLSDKP